MKPTSAALLLLAGQAVDAIDYNAAPPNLSTLANGSLFETWRPRAHVLPVSGKTGDPCMKYTDPKTGLFHVGWLHNDSGITGATTDDMVTYRDLNGGGPSIVPGGINDPLAVFDGSVIPRGINGTPTLIYTSVSFLPIHWSIPYTRGAESQSLAVSYDGGRNFTKVNQGPVIPEAPFGVNVTAFRDPYVFQNPQLDTLSDSSVGTWYTVVSGGVHDVGPSQFLYRQTDPDFQYWEYLGEWWREGVNTTWGDGTWAGGWGFNFETGNIFGLNDEGYDPEGEVFNTLGTEGSNAPIKRELSSIHDLLWTAGKISNNGSIKFTPTMAGVLDWGASAYAAAGKVLTADSQASKKSGAPARFVTYPWLTGDEYGQAKLFPTRQQNWTGTLLLPRELHTLSIHNVVDNELARETGVSWRVQGKSKSGTLELKTLGIDIARETYNALTRGSSTDESDRKLSNQSTPVPFAKSPENKFFVLRANLTFPQSARKSGLKSGFQILSSEFESTNIYYQFSNESIIIDRSNTSAAAQSTSGITTYNEAGRLRLFDVVEDGAEKIESLELTIVVDNGVLEVFANGRFALSTWARSWYAKSTGIKFLHNGVGQVQFSDVSVSEGLFEAWPERQ
ncbi:extracellular invertase [Aspergillus steynii IBT 23096]|uniref:Extracellular invertase n=1 Tax=Aspergillus steynii IBT 23096 TaxID=1392250 RepID=A0A2I2GKB0_9EURO|nr:extracellular invertase [Aspergillus steynii IBT 23096]PLB53318.1 extracellular invertase [Aspergillus steynii IBT 23096]